MKRIFFLLLFCSFNLSIFSNEIPKDRWIIMDFNWFNPSTLNQQADTLFDRYLPVWKNTSGDKGIIFCFDWVVDLITDYSGNINQKLPFHSKYSSLWNNKTYSDIKKFIAILKAKSVENKLTNFHIGMQCNAWASNVMVQGKYDFTSNWSERHPELYKKYGSFDPLATLNEDHFNYATRLEGIKNGESFAVFFGDQWGVVSKEIGLDALLLWDSWATIKCYNRMGVFGDRAGTDTMLTKKISNAIITIFHELKRKNTNSFIMGYSSGSSAIGEYRVNTFDLEALVADGSIDAWIDQTWSGAWNDFWGAERNGWTFQMEYQLQHELMVASGNSKRVKSCKHYNIIGAFDAFEPWDVIHTTPDKLRWSIWAYNNAAIITPKGYKTIDGSMIAWCNSPSLELLSKSDIKFISESVNDADESAIGLSNVYGVTSVYNKSEMDWLNSNDPSSFNSEWIDEQSAMLMKWGLPVMSATRIEWMPELDIEKKIWLYQLPGQLNEKEINPT